MRMPPLPTPAPIDAPGRVVGNRPTTPAQPITISAYDPSWPELFRHEETRIRGALGPVALAVDHVGSTAVPGLAAKDRVDIDLIVADPADEDSYVPALVALGYTLATREPHWYEHRCLWDAGHRVNLHVFGPDCDEHLRHLILRDWLRAHPDDRERYAARKVESAAANPLSMTGYVAGKAGVILDILRRAGLS